MPVLFCIDLDRRGKVVVLYVDRKDTTMLLWHMADIKKGKAM